ncbi:MAG: protein tyrosine phosphatase [Pseudomonadota bacterium]
MIHVCSLSALERVVAETGARHVITLLNPEDAKPTPQGVDPANHLRIGINDVARPMFDCIEPQRQHIDDILTFADGWDRQSPLVVHCWAGISRSTATALTILCSLSGGRDVEAHAKALRKAAPHASPNPLLIQYADEALELEGRLTTAVKNLTPAALMMEGPPFCLPLPDPLQA